MAHFPEFLGDILFADGGVYVDGSNYTEVDENQIRKIAEKIKASSVRNVVVAGTKKLMQDPGTGQVSAWQSVTANTSCNSVQPVPARVEEPVSQVKQSSSHALMV